MNGSEVGEPVPAGHPAGCLDCCSLSGCFDDRDFLVRQAVEGVHECIDPPIGRAAFGRGHPCRGLDMSHHMGGIIWHRLNGACCGRIR
jgi:hypothetical protein